MSPVVMSRQLLAIGDNLWIAEGPVVNFYSFPYPTRMVVVRLVNGALWVWSPIALTADLRAAVEALGRPTHLVSPNKIHHLFLGEWATAYPEASLWGLPSVIHKRRDLAFVDALDYAAPPAWRGEIDQVVFRGSPVMDEIVFFHRASRTAIFADLIENFAEDFLRTTPGWRGWRGYLARKVWKIAAPDGMAPLEWRLSFLRRSSAKATLATVLAWGPVRVIIAHGTCARQDGQAFIRRSFRWLAR